jgi:cytochrome P450
MTVQIAKQAEERTSLSPCVTVCTYGGEARKTMPEKTSTATESSVNATAHRGSESRSVPFALRDLPAPKGLPLIGNAHQIQLPRFHQQLEAWAEELGDLYRLRMFGRSHLVVANSSSIQEILQARPHDYRRWSQIESVSRELDVLGVFAAEGKRWKDQRKVILPAFSMRQQRTLFPVATLHTQRLRALWQKAAEIGQAVDVHADLTRFAVDVTCSVVLGCDFNTIEGHRSEFRSLLGSFFSVVYQRLNAPVPYWRWFKLRHDREIERARRDLEDILRPIVANARAALERDHVRATKPETLLDGILVAQARAAPEERLADMDISANLLTMLLAGEDTTSNTMTWMLHYLSCEPEIQSHLQDEFDAVFGATRQLTYDDLSKLRFAEAVALETLRLRSPSPLLFIEATRPVTLGTLALPQGTKLLLLTRRAALSATNFANPDKFRPHRWLDAATSSDATAHQPRAMLAFGAGPRTCPGRSLALFECSMVLAMVAQHFTITNASPSTVVTESLDFTMQPRGVRLHLRDRNALLPSAQERSAPSLSQR